MLSSPELEVVLVLCAGAGVLGLLLWLVGRRYAIFLMRTGRADRRPLTRAGMLFYGLYTLCLLGGLSLRWLLPESWIGRVVNSSLGFVAFLGFFALLSAIVERFVLRDVKLVGKSDNDPETGTWSGGER